MTKKRKSKLQAHKMRLWSIVLIIVSFILFAIAALLYSNRTGPTETGGGDLATPISRHDFGVVPVGGGVVTAELPVDLET